MAAGDLAAGAYSCEHLGLSRVGAGEHPLDSGVEHGTDLGADLFEPGLIDDPLFDKFFPEQRDRVPFQPLVQLTRWTVGAFVRSRVTCVPVSLRLDQRRPTAVARPLHGPTDSGLDGVDVLTVDNFARHRVRGRSHGYICDRSGAVDTRVLAILIVLADENDR